MLRLPFGPIFTALLTSRLRLISEPCGASAGDSRAAPPDRSPATLREAAEADACGSTLVGMALYGLAGLEVRRLHHESLHRCRLASQGLSPVLDLEDSTWETRATERAEGSSRVDSHHEPRKSALGSSTDSWRIAQTRHRDRRNQCEQIHGAQSETAIADVADFPRESSEEHGVGRLLCCADDPVSDPVCVSGAGA